MGHQGRYGKYGEIKRFNCLRKAGWRKTPAGLPAQGLPFIKFRKEGLTATPLERVKIHPAKSKDKDFVDSLSDEAFAVYGPYREIIDSWFIADSSFTTIATIGKKPIGFGMLGFMSDENYKSRIGELLAIAVIPEHQGQGIGRKILDVIESQAKELRVIRLCLHTALENLIAQKLFVKQGFRIVGCKECYYPAGQSAIMMIKEWNVPQSIGKTGILTLE